MKKRPNIQLSPGTHLKHFRVWCSHCKTVVKTCKANDDSALKQCPHIEKLSFRFVAFVPGTKRRVVRSLGTNFNEAIKQAAILKQQLENGSFEIVSEKSTETTTIVQAQPSPDAKPELLTHLFGKYLASLNGEGVAAHLKLVRSKSHVNDVKNTFKQFLVSLKSAKIDAATLCPSEINDQLVGIFHSHLISKGYSPSSYNRVFSHFTTFCSWLEQEGYPSAKRFLKKSRGRQLHRVRK